MTITEWRGVTDLVAAEVLADSTDGISWGTPFPIAGVASIEKTTDGSSEAHYYNNIPAVVVSGSGADTMTINVSALSLEVQAKLNGQYYDDTTGAMIESTPTEKYFAIGYKTQKVDGSIVYVWRYKGRFAPIGSTHNTIDNSTTANGQQLTYTGVATTYKFTKTGKGASGINVDLSLDRADVSSFFSAVTTPDTLGSTAVYKLRLNSVNGGSATVQRPGSATNLADEADIYAGETLRVYFTSGNDVTIEMSNVWGPLLTTGAAVVVTGHMIVTATVPEG